MEKIKKYIHIGMTLLIPILTVALILTVKSRGKIEKRWKESTENVKSYSELFSNYENKNNQTNSYGNACGHIHRIRLSGPFPAFPGGKFS